MDKLILLSKEYESLRKESHKELQLYLEKHKGEDFTELARSRIIPKWKLLERDADAFVSKFVRKAKQFGKENNLSYKDLVISISNEIINTKPPSINHYLLINLMWERELDENNFCLATLAKMIRNLLKYEKITQSEEYYLESYIDIWNYDTDDLIPLDILEDIILLEPDVGAPHGALIKAKAYLSRHKNEDVERVLEKARKTKSYKEDDYYREWID